MNKLKSLRDYLLANIPTLAQNPERLLIFADKGKVISNSLSLSFEYDYTDNLIVTDFATPVTSVETRANGDNVRMIISPKGMWTLGVESDAPSTWRRWSSKKMCGRSVSRIAALSMPPRKKAALTRTPQPWSERTTRSCAGALRAVTRETCRRGR